MNGIICLNGLVWVLITWDPGDGLHHQCGAPDSSTCVPQPVCFRPPSSSDARPIWTFPVKLYISRPRLCAIFCYLRSRRRSSSPMRRSKLVDLRSSTRLLSSIDFIRRSSDIKRPRSSSNLIGSTNYWRSYNDDLSLFHLPSSAADESRVAKGLADDEKEPKTSGDQEKRFVEGHCLFRVSLLRTALPLKLYRGYVALYRGQLTSMFWLSLASRRSSSSEFKFITRLGRIHSSKNRGFWESGDP